MNFIYFVYFVYLIYTYIIYYRLCMCVYIYMFVCVQYREERNIRTLQRFLLRIYTIVAIKKMEMKETICRGHLDSIAVRQTERFSFRATFDSAVSLHSRLILFFLLFPLFTTLFSPKSLRRMNTSASLCVGVLSFSFF